MEVVPPCTWVHPIWMNIWDNHNTLFDWSLVLKNSSQIKTIMGEYQYYPNATNLTYSVVRSKL